MCPKCGYKIIAHNDNFCRHCGNNLTQLMFVCRYCRAMTHKATYILRGNRVEQKYCALCGNELEPIHNEIPSSLESAIQ